MGWLRKSENISETGEGVYLDMEAEDDEYAKEVIDEKLKEVKTDC